MRGLLVAWELLRAACSATNWGKIRVNAKEATRARETLAEEQEAILVEIRAEALVAVISAGGQVEASAEIKEAALAVGTLAAVAEETSAEAGVEVAVATSKSFYALA